MFGPLTETGTPTRPVPLPLCLLFYVGMTLYILVSLFFFLLLLKTDSLKSHILCPDYGFSLTLLL